MKARIQASARLRRLRYGLALVAPFAAGGCGGEAEPEQLPRIPLGAAQEEPLFVLPSERTHTHWKVSESGVGVAAWVRLPDAVQLHVAGQEPREFRGHMGFQQAAGGAFHAVEPRGRGDVRIVGSGAEQDTWLVWGPGEDMVGESLDEYLRFTRDGAGVLYATYASGRWSWVADTVVLEGYHQLTPPATSADGAIVAWVEDTEGGQRVIFNGTPESTYDRVFSSSLRVSPDGAHHSYAVSSGEMMHVVRDGAAQAGFRSLRQPVFSPDGQRMAYAAQDVSGLWRVVVDGEPGSPHEEVAALTFSADGIHFAYAVRDGDEWAFVVDGVLQASRFDGVSYSFSFAPNTGRFAYAGVRDSTWFAVVDGEEGDGYGGVFGLAFSPDGRRFTRGEISSDSVVLITLEGQGQWTHTGVPALAESHISPDGSSVIYALRRDAQVRYARNGQEGPAFDRIGVGRYSPIAQDLVYLGETSDGKNAMFVNHEPGRAFESIPCGPFFSSDDQLIYCGYAAEKWHMVVGDSLGRGFDRILLPSSRELSLRPDASFEYLALAGDTVLRVRHPALETR